MLSIVYVVIDRGDEASGLDLEEEGEGPVRNSADLQPIPRSRNIGVILAFHVQVGTFSTCALFPLSLARLSTGFVVRPHILSSCISPTKITFDHETK